MEMTIAHWGSTKVSSFTGEEFFGSLINKTIHVPFFVDIRS